MTTRLFDNQFSDLSFTVSQNAKYDNPGGTTNNPSIFNIMIHGEGLGAFGIYDGYCIQPWMRIKDGTFESQLGYSTETFEFLTYSDLDEDLVRNETTLLTNQEARELSYVLQNLSWEQRDGDAALEGVMRSPSGEILNPKNADGDYVYLEPSDVQFLIWDMLYGIYAPNYAGGVFNTSPYGVRNLSSSENTMLKENILPFAKNFEPKEETDHVGIVLRPKDGSQPLITSIEIKKLADLIGSSPEEILEEAQDQIKEGILTEIEDGFYDNAAQIHEPDALLAMALFALCYVANGLLQFVLNKKVKDLKEVKTKLKRQD